MDNKRKNITLTLTQRCNLNCTYCYENHKSTSIMPFDMVKNILDKELNDTNFEEYEIDFFGGEPFLAFDIIKQCYDYVTENYSNKKLIFFITTNIQSCDKAFHRIVKTVRSGNRNGILRR